MTGCARFRAPSSFVMRRDASRRGTPDESAYRAGSRFQAWREDRVAGQRPRLIRQDGIVVVTGGPAHIHEVPVPDRVEGCAEAQPGDEVRVGEERPAEGHQVGSGRQHLPRDPGDGLCGQVGQVRVADRDAGPVGPDPPVPAGCRIGAHQVQTGEVQPLQAVQERGVEAVGVFLQNAADRARGGDSDAHPVRADRVGNRLGHLRREPHPPRGGAAVAVGAAVGVVCEELVQQHAVGRVHLHALESRVDGPACGGGEVGDRVRMSSVVIARGTAACRWPCGVKILSGSGTAEGARGVRPVVAGWLTRPPCWSCRNIRPPAACTASVTRRQPEACRPVCIAVMSGYVCPAGSTA